MSRATSAAAHTSPAGILVRGHRTPGRHRLGRPEGVRVTDLVAVRERLRAERRSGAPRNAFLRWLLGGTSNGRHTWGFLADAGGRPRTAFAIILSL